MKQKKRSSLIQRWLLPINFPLKHKRFGKAAVTWCLRLAQFWGKYEKQFQRWSVSSGRTWEVVLNRLIEKLIVDCQWLGRSDNGLLNQFDLREDSASSSSEICFESQVFEAGARSPQLELDKWDEDWSCEVFLTKCRPLVRDTPLARWFRLFLKLGSLSVKVERGNLSRQINDSLLPQLGIQTIKHSGWQGVGSLWASKNLP